MSATSARRLKDRGGAGGKITAPKLSKPLTPSSVSISVIGKENSRPVSRISAQKPTTRPAPKFSGDAAVPRCSSAPRARNPSPLGRADSAGRKDRVISRVSANGCEAEKKDKAGFARNVVVAAKASEGIGDGSRVLRKSGSCKESAVCTGDLSGIGSKISISRSRVDANSVNVRKSKEGPVVDLNRVVKDRIVTDQKVQDSLSRLVGSSQLMNETTVGEKDDKLHKRRDSFSRLGVAGEKLSNAVLEKSKEKGLGPDSGSHQVESKYQSRLHEKLALLEGKVKRIASDIKRTKEMLDMNNPDASKVILTNIQEKISGIEKAMVHSGGDSDAKGSSSKDVAIDAQNSKELREKIKNCGATGSKGLVKDLNSEELEARLFPHHKLLRNRASLKASLVSAKPTTKACKDNDLCYFEENVIPSLEEIKPNSVAEYPTVVESQATLNEEEQVNMEICDAQEMDASVASSAPEEKLSDVRVESSLVLTTDECLDEFDNQENRKSLIMEDANEEACLNQLIGIGCKTATGGWFVSEGEAALLVHDDGSCSYFDIANSEEKAEYRCPVSVSPNIWRDCWIIRAAGSDGCSGRYVVAASAGNSMDSGFCSWEFYTKDVCTFHIEDTVPPPSRTVLGPLPANPLYRRNVLSNALVPEIQRWWYKPCGPLIVSTATSQKGVSVYDIRDGEQIMKWDVQRPVLTMDYSSPLQWRNRGKVVIAESEGISLWDVNSVQPQALLSVSSSGRKISALHINNTDAEIGGGVRHRVTSAAAEGNDGVYCTSESIEVLDFRQPTGIGLKIQKRGVSVDSVFCRGDSIFIGCKTLYPSSIKQGTPQLQQFSLRKQSLVGTYSFPETTPSSHSAITQVWGNSTLTMGVSGQGLFVFDTVKDDGLQLFCGDYAKTSPEVRQVIGPDDLYYPSFDYASSRALLISRDRPASWMYLP